MQDDYFNRLLLIREKFDEISFYLDEKTLRIWCATEANNYNKIFGRGGITIVHRATGLSRTTIRNGIEDLQNDQVAPRTRKEGGGRKKLTDKYQNLLGDLESLVEPFSRGDPESPLRWTCKSVRNLADELNKKGYVIGFRTVCDLLVRLEYSLQSNKKTKEGLSHPDRDKQFKYINKKVKKFQGNRECSLNCVTA